MNQTLIISHQPNCSHYGSGPFQDACKVASIDNTHATDPDEIIEHTFVPTSVRVVRLIPVSELVSPACLRTELYGCYRNDSIAYYQEHIIKH